MSRRRHSETGDTLIEVLIALAVIGITASALLGAFTTTISASSVHRNLATLDTALKSYVESVSQQLDQQANFDNSCTGMNTYAHFDTTQVYQNVTYTLSITNAADPIQYWQLNGNTWGSACTPSQTPAPQQLITAVVSSSSTPTQSLEFVVSDPQFLPGSPSAPSFTPNTVNESVPVGIQIDPTFFAAGYPTPSLSASGLPSGNWATFVDLGGGNGTLFIDPPASAVRTMPYSVTITAANGVGSGTLTINITVTQAPTITSSNSDTVAPGTPFTWGPPSGGITTTGTPTPSLSISGQPSWLQLMDNGDGTGTLSATTPLPGNFTFTIEAQNSAGSYPQTFTLIVNAAVAPAFTSPNSDTVPVGVAISPPFSITATGLPLPAITEMGPLPQGVNFNPGNGSATLSGTPTQAGTFVVTFMATNIGGSAPPQSFTLTVTPRSSPQITSTTPSPVTVKKTRSVSFTVTGSGFQSGITISTSAFASANCVFNSPTSLSCGGSNASSPNSYSFTLTNPDGGTATSSANAIQVNN